MLDMKRAVALSLCLLAASSTIPVRAQDQGFSEVTDVVAVEVPVQVLRGNEPVRGLTADDFEIYEGRKKMPITGFEVLDLAETAGAAPARRQTLPVAARRHFLLLFDLSFSEPKAVLAARGAAEDLVNGLHPSDLVGVAVYAGSKGAQLVLRFTADRRQVRAAIESLGAPQLQGRAADPLQLVLVNDLFVNEDNRFLPGDIAGQARGEVQQAKVDAVAAFLQTVLNESDKAERNVRQKQVTAMSRSVGELARMLSSVEGRKHVVYFSEGFDSSLIQGTSDAAEQERMNSSSQFGEFWNVDSEQRYGSTKTVSDVEKMLEELRRADCVVQAVDIGGLKAGGNLGQQRTGGKESLFMMAKATGGDFYENSNDLTVAMKEMLERTSVTYVLAFQPEGLARDGAYHKVRVELKDAKGMRVVHRPGYYAPRPYAQRSAHEKLMDAAEKVISGAESDDLRASVLAAPFRVDGASPADAGTAYVPVVIEVDGPRLLGGARSGTLPAEIYVYAMDSNGAIRDHVTQTIGLDLGKVEPALRQSGLKFFGHLDLPPGDYSLRVLVRNGLTGVSALKTVAVQVPAFTQAPRVLLPPFFAEPAGKWLVVREATSKDDRQVAYPFMMGEEPFIPASLPVLSPGREARLSLVGYNLGKGDLRVESKILSQDGREVGPAEVRLERRDAGGPAAPDRLTAIFRPSQLAPGEYLLLVTVNGSDGSAGTSTAPFVVEAGAQKGR
jgi:VWFA-related protein